MKKNIDADSLENFSSENDDLLNFTPNDNDELVIENATSAPKPEVDESAQSSEQTVQQPEPEIVEPTPKEEEKILEVVEEMKTEPQPEPQEQPAPPAPEMNSEESEDLLEDEYNQNDEEMEKKRAKGIIIILLVIIALLLLLLGGCVWMYFAIVKPLLYPPKVEVVKDTIPEPVVDTVPPVVEVVDTLPVDTVVPAPKTYYPERRIAGKNKVPTAGWLIGYKATPNEAEAIKTVAELSYVDSIPCGYYWINDARKGKKLFKVYVGPYKTQAEVEAVFPTIKTRVPDAHIYSEDAQLLEMYRQQKQVYTAE